MSKGLREHLQEEFETGNEDYLDEFYERIEKAVEAWLTEKLKETNCGDWLDGYELLEELKQK